MRERDLNSLNFLLKLGATASVGTFVVEKYLLKETNPLSVGAVALSCLLPATGILWESSVVPKVKESILPNSIVKLEL